MTPRTRQIPQINSNLCFGSIPASPADSVPIISKLNSARSQPQTFPLAEPPIPTSTGANLQAPNFGFWRLSIHTVCAMTWEPGALLFIAAAQRNGGKPALSHSSKCWSHSGACPVLPVPPPHPPFVTCMQGQVALGQAMPGWRQGHRSCSTQPSPCGTAMPEQHINCRHQTFDLCREEAALGSGKLQSRASHTWKNWSRPGSTHPTREDSSTQPDSPARRLLRRAQHFGSDFFPLFFDI